MPISTWTVPSSVSPGDLEAGVEEDPQHPGVLGEHLGDEAAYALVPRGGREVLEQQAADAAAAQGVGDQEGHLGGVGADPLGGRERDHAAVHRGDQAGHRVRAAALEEVRDVVVPGAAAGGEEPQPQAGCGGLVVQRLEAGPVRGPDLADDGHRAVREQDVGGGHAARHARAGGRGEGDHAVILRAGGTVDTGPMCLAAQGRRALPGQAAAECAGARHRHEWGRTEEFRCWCAS